MKDKKKYFVLIYLPTQKIFISQTYSAFTNFFGVKSSDSVKKIVLNKKRLSFYQCLFFVGDYIPIAQRTENFFSEEDRKRIDSTYRAWKAEMKKRKKKSRIRKDPIYYLEQRERRLRDEQ